MSICPPVAWRLAVNFVVVGPAALATAVAAVAAVATAVAVAGFAVAAIVVAWAVFAYPTRNKIVLRLGTAAGAVSVSVG
jgi:hypothetical protein